MTAPPIVSAPARGGAAVARLPLAVPATVVVLLILRALEFRDGATPDEGGFLLVGSQWHAGGSSLYGDYWVDRPPLLIGLFRLASLTGGLVSLRVIGALAAAIAVLLLSSTALRVYGRRAATWTAIVAAALLVSPMYGSVDVNGELLAVPFVALGLRAAVEAVLAEDRLVSRGAGLLAGGAAVAALLVKQNFADVLVFTAVAWVFAWRQRRIGGRDLAGLIGLAALGAIVCYAVVMLVALAHGTSPIDAYDATYPFRVKAAHVIAEGSSAGVLSRLHRLGVSFLLSGVPLVLLGFLGFGLRRSRAPYLAWSLVATSGWVVASILAGGNYWLHYLVESIPVVALAAGAVSLAAPRVLRVVVAAVVVSAAITVGVVVATPAATPGSTVGRSIAASSEPGDTLISAFGDPDIPRSAGMASPYPYLWSLPSRTLDPHLTRLGAVLNGPEAPTWIVTNGPSLARISDNGLGAVLAAKYRSVGEVCSRTIYLLRGIERPSVHRDGSCSGTVLP